MSAALDHVTQTLPFQTTKLFLESLSFSKLESAFYDGGVTNGISIVFRDVIGLAKAFANLNTICRTGGGDMSSMALCRHQMV